MPRRSVWEEVQLRLPTLLVAGALFWLARDGGAYREASRDTVAIALWWAVIVAVGFGIWPVARPPLAALTVGALLAALVLVTLVSLWWAPSAENAFADFTLAALYLAVFVVVVLSGRRSQVGRWADGIALGISAITLLSLGSRLLPDVVPGERAQPLLPALYTRLSYPIGYWNALGVFVALSLPVLLRSALVASTPLRRGVSLAPVPLVVAVIYFTSSRGAVATAVVATAVFIGLTARRWSALLAAAAAAPACALAFTVLTRRDELATRPWTAAAESQGRSAAILLLAASLLTAAIYALLCRRALSDFTVPRTVGRIAAVVALALVVAGVAAAQPIERFRTFKAPPSNLVVSNSKSTVQSHLFSANGSGRWQLWHSAVDEFETRPLLGRGAGTYEAWWAEHGTLTGFVKNAHSLYLEELGELGLIGFVLLAGALLTGLVAGARRTLVAREEERITAAALTACFAGFLVAAGIDWMWEIPAVAAVGVICLALLTGPATAVFEGPRPVDARQATPSRYRLRFGPGALIVLVSWLFICAHAIPLFAGLKIRDSQAAATAGNVDKAVSAAIDARNIEPWAATPYLQLALVAEQAGALDTAREWVAKALDRDSNDWQLWLVATRLDTKREDIRAAKRDLERARSLNPRSALFSAAPPPATPPPAATPPPSS